MRFIKTANWWYGICLDGYAFSQEEGGPVSQAAVIRAYNTNEPKPDGM